MAQRRRTYGTKKEGALNTYSPVQLASIVVSAYDHFNPETKTADWVKGIKKYQNNPEQQMMVIGRLSAWYDVLNEKKNRIAKVYDEEIKPAYQELARTVVEQIRKKQGTFYNIVQNSYQTIQEYRSVPDETYMENKDKYANDIANAISSVFAPAQQAVPATTPPAG